MNRRRIAAIMALAASVTAGATGGVASGGEASYQRVATEITINDRCAFDCRAVAPRRNYTVDFFGKVRSDVPKCERRRKIGLYRRASGGGFDLIGTTRSDAEGRWEITRNDKPGFTKYLVKAAADRKGDTLCLRATDKESHDSF